MGWLREAANHAEEIEALLLANYHLTQIKLDAMWTYEAFEKPIDRN